MCAAKDTKDNDAILKELDKLEFLFHGTSDAPNVPSFKSKSSSIPKSLDGLLGVLTDAKSQLASGVSPDAVKDSLGKVVEDRKKDIDERQKEIYNSLGRIGKSLDKVCSWRIVPTCESYRMRRNSLRHCPNTLPYLIRQKPQKR